MNDFYEDDFILESKKEDDDDDDRLLSHGLNKKKKENPYYTDYKNQQIMAGKAVKTEKGWKKEENRKKWIKRGIALAGTAAVAAGGRHVYKMNTDADYRNRHNEKKAQKKADRQYWRTTTRGMVKDAQTTANRERELQNMQRNNNYNNEFTNMSKKTNQKPSWWKRTKYKLTGHYEEDLNILFENMTNEQIIAYSNYINESSDKEAWKKYVEKQIDKGLPPKSYKQWKKDKKELKHKIIKGALLTTGAIAAGVDIHGRVTGKGGLPEQLKHRKEISKANRYARDKQNENERDSIYHKARVDGITGYEEEFSAISSNDLNSYIETISTNEDFNKASYERYCVMMEARGLTPMDESLFSQAKEHVSAYAKAAIEGIKREKAKKDEELERMQKEKAEKKAKEAKEEKEKLSKMYPEEKKAYLRKKRKEEEKQEEKEQDQHDLKQAFKQSFVRGSGEQLGKTAAKLATRVIAK